MQNKPVILVALALFTASGCLKGPSEEEYDDVATGVGALSASSGGGETESFKDATTASKGDLPEGLAQMGKGDLQGRRGGVSYSWELTCTDANGRAMDACTLLTDTAHLVLHFDGDAQGATWNASLTRDGDWTLSDLTTDVAELNGTGSFHADAAFMAIYRNVSRSFVLDYEANYNAVKIRRADLALLSGTVHYEIHAEATKSRGSHETTRQFDISADLTFNGTNTAELLLDGDHRYTVQLDRGAVTRDVQVMSDVKR